MPACAPHRYSNAIARSSGSFPRGKSRSFALPLGHRHAVNSVSRMIRDGLRTLQGQQTWLPPANPGALKLICFDKSTSTVDSHQGLVSAPGSAGPDFLKAKFVPIRGAGEMLPIGVLASHSLKAATGLAARLLNLRFFKRRSHVSSVVILRSPIRLVSGECAQALAILQTH